MAKCKKECESEVFWYGYVMAFNVELADGSYICEVKELGSNRAFKLTGTALNTIMTVQYLAYADKMNQFNAYEVRVGDHCFVVEFHKESITIC